MTISKTDRMVISMAVTLVIFTAIVCFADFYKQSVAVRQSSLRLHIIANSDSDEDQSLKLAVRDRILEEYGEILGDCESREQAVSVANLLKADIKRTAEKTLHENNREENCEIFVTDMFFDTKQYEDDVMPAGRYTALRIVIGAGEGQNWWCVMYPPLCIPAASEQQAQNLENRIHMLSQQPNYVAKFKAVEVIEKLKESIDKAFKV